MSVDLTLQQTNTSGRLLPALLSDALTRLSGGAPKKPTIRGTMRGQELRLAIELSPTDPASATFPLEFGMQGLRVNGTAHGPSAALLTYVFHALAETLQCTLLDASDGSAGHKIEAKAAVHEEGAVAYLADYEDQVRETRNQKAKGIRQSDEQDAREFVLWLAREEDIALSEDEDGLSKLYGALPLNDAPALYEMLIDSEAVDDVFLSERQLASALERYLARNTLR